MTKSSHHTRSVYPHSSVKRFNAWQGALLFLQSIITFVPSSLVREPDWIFISVSCFFALLGLLAFLIPSATSKSGNNCILPFAGVTAVGISSIMHYSSPAVLAFVVIWMMIVTIGEHRKYYVQRYLIFYLLYTTLTVCLSVILLPNIMFDTSEILMTLAGGTLLSAINMYLLYVEFLKPKVSKSSVARKPSKPTQLKELIADIMRSDNGLESALWQVSQRCIPLLGLEDCVIYLFNEETNKLVQMAAYGNKTPEGSEIILDPIEIEPGKGVVGKCFETGKNMLIADLSQFEGYIVDDAQRNSELAVPIFCGNNVIGVIDSEHSKPNFFTSFHLSSFEYIATKCGEKCSFQKLSNRQ